MTIAANVKQSLATIKGIEADLSSLALRTQDQDSKKTLHETMMIMHEIVTDVKKRVGDLEREEFQYKGF